MHDEKFRSTREKKNEYERFARGAAMWNQWKLIQLWRGKERASSN